MRRFASLEVCMYSRCCALIGACISIVAFGHSSAETSSSTTLMVSHHAWGGHAKKSATRDGSVLNEFIAQTDSVNSPGAVLLVSMIPRFGCVPVISIMSDEAEITARAAVVEFSAVLDAESMDFPTILDRDGTNAQFTLSSSRSEQNKLRHRMDWASWASFEWNVNSDVPQLSNESPADESLAVSGSIDFSLLGSRKTLQSMEEMCRSHKPIPLTN